MPRASKKVWAGTDSTTAEWLDFSVNSESRAAEVPYLSAMERSPYGVGRNYFLGGRNIPTQNPAHRLGVQLFLLSAA